VRQNNAAATGGYGGIIMARVAAVGRRGNIRMLHGIGFLAAGWEDINLKNECRLSMK